MSVVNLVCNERSRQKIVSEGKRRAVGDVPIRATLGDRIAHLEVGEDSVTLLRRRNFSSLRPADILERSLPTTWWGRLLLCLSVCVFVTAVLVLELILGMGQSASTPLSLTLDHWSEVRNRAHNQSLEVRKGPWQTFCSSEWPAFDVGWPPEGTLDKEVIKAVKAIVFQEGPGSHPDQGPYIVTWENLAYYPPPWLKPWVKEKKQNQKPSSRDLAMIATLKEKTKEPPTAPTAPKIYPEIEGPPEWPTPPPYRPEAPPAPRPPGGAQPNAEGPVAGTRRRKDRGAEGPPATPGLWTPRGPAPATTTTILALFLCRFI